MIDSYFQYSDHCIEDLYFSDVTEAERILSIKNAISAVDSGERFAFYDVSFADDMELLLSRYHVERLNQLVLYLSQESQLQDVITEWLNETMMQRGDAFHIACVMTRLVSNILSASERQDAEVIVRAISHNDYADKSCKIWHVDKSLGQLAKSGYGDEELMGVEEEQKFFLVSMFGEATRFYNSDAMQLQEFMHSVDKDGFFYGHASEEQCVVKTPQFIKYNNDARSAQYGHGSVHVAGCNGTIHAAPIKSINGRLLLLITPIKHEFKERMLND